MWVAQEATRVFVCCVCESDSVSPWNDPLEMIWASWPLWITFLNEPELFMLMITLSYKPASFLDDPWFDYISLQPGFFLWLPRQCAWGVAGATLQGPVWSRAPQAICLQAASLTKHLLPGAVAAAPALWRHLVKINAAAGWQLSPSAVSHQIRLLSKGTGQRRLRRGPQCRPNQDGVWAVNKSSKASPKP